VTQRPQRFFEFESELLLLNTFKILISESDAFKILISESDVRINEALASQCLAYEPSALKPESPSLRVQINEAFAAQYLACEKALEIDPTKANLDGGAIAIGHPTGAKYIKP
jgi:hypothetical protein